MWHVVKSEAINRSATHHRHGLQSCILESAQYDARTYPALLRSTADATSKEQLFFHSLAIGADLLHRLEFETIPLSLQVWFNE